MKTEPETLTAGERAALDEMSALYGGLSAKLLRLYDAALARAEDLERACYSDGHGAHAEDLLKLRAAESRLAEATALLRRVDNALEEEGPWLVLQSNIRAFLSTTPAPAATAEPVREYTWDGHALPMVHPEPTLVERIEATVNRWTRFGIAGDCAREILALIRAAKEGA